jgi:hypothetical protein
MAHASTAEAKAVDESYASAVSERLYRTRRLATRVLIAGAAERLLMPAIPMISHKSLNISFNLI